jgi:hypothetical protein
MSTIKPESSKQGVVIIDWNTSGHHLTYLKEYVLAFTEKGIPTIVLSPENPQPGAPRSNMMWWRIPGIDWIRKRKRFGTPVARWRYARLLLAGLRAGEKTLGCRCGTAIFGCFHENQSKVSSRVIRTLGLPAAGLYIHAGMFHTGDHLRDTRISRKVGDLLRQPLLKTIYMLDHDMLGAVADFSGKETILLPDVTDCRHDDAEPLPARLGLVPKTRPVIGLLGHLRPSKGVAEMIGFALAQPDLNATFLLAGSCRWEEFPPDQEKLIKHAVANDPRVVFHPERIPDGSPYNSLVKACDVLWAVYRDCPHSSNTLSKAAFFERPVIVADGHLMARQTRQYSLGEVVPQDDPAALRAALQPMLADPAAWCRGNMPRWHEFRELHSNERFRSILRETAL